MNIVSIASEFAPVAKVCGIADVVYGLSRELEIRGNQVEIILPKYDCMHYNQIDGLTICRQELSVPWYNYFIQCSVWIGFVHGQKCFFIDPHSEENFFNRGFYYGFPDDWKRFAFFCKAALEFMLQSGKRPDVIHTHAWQTALISALLYEIYQYHGMRQQRICHTIHNFEQQGIADEEMLWATGLERPDYYFSRERMGDDFNLDVLNYSKAATVYANFITTVSPQHAYETRFSDQGKGLGHMLHLHQAKYSGILNGLDYEMWNPEIDALIPFHYHADDIDNKYHNKATLCRRLSLVDCHKPIIAYVGRLDEQKGLQQIHHALYYALENDAQFVLLGTGMNLVINDSFRDVKRQLLGNPDCYLEIGYNEELAHLIYAGADMMLVPSLYEPCGLTQMIALRYGTVPIVRAIGGLLDTVFDWDYSDKPQALRNGFVFHQADNSGVESAVKRAIALWHHDPEAFYQLLKNGMAYDFSWHNSGQNYLNIYEYIRHK